MLKILLSFTLCTLVTTAVMCQTLHGLVTDEAGNPLSFATVYVPDLKLGTAANADGAYAIEIGQGTYRVRFQYLGYRTQEFQAKLGSDDLEFNMVLPLHLS
jgi:hypothetical protein